MDQHLSHAVYMTTMGKKQANFEGEKSKGNLEICEKFHLLTALK